MPLIYKMPHKGYFPRRGFVELLYKQKIKFMKKNLLALTLIISSVFLFSSCKKDSAAAGNTASAANLAAGKCDIRFDYSGAASGTFASTLAISSAASSGVLYNISGGAVSGLTPLLTMIITPANTTVGTYAQSAAGADLPNNMVFTFTSGSNGWATGGGTAAGFKIIVTAVTSNTIEGTFSGDLGSDANSTKVTITNGSFAAKF
jgi:hypothetical protein